MTTGEGGMIITNDENAAALMRALRNQGRAPGDTWLSHTYLGYNYRLDEMSSALGITQLRRLDEMLAKREQVAAWYSERLGKMPESKFPLSLPKRRACRGSFMSSALTQKLTGNCSRGGLKRAEFRFVHISCRSTFSLTWSSGLVIVKAISR